MRLALALSGGGVRASVFHCGVLQRLAVGGLLEHTKFISTVSGGSLVSGLVVSANDMVWPNSSVYLSSVLPEVKKRLTSGTVQSSYAWRSMLFPGQLLHGRAHLLADQFKAQWGLEGSLNQLPKTPRWLINATCYETGKNWRFSQPRMGDYRTHYVINPDFPLADALAASAAVPGLIGPLVIRSKEYHWHRFVDSKLQPTQPATKRYELWDGGVYDNLGIEALYKPDGGFREGFDFLIVSDASAPLDFDPKTIRRSLKPWQRMLRLVDIATDQVRGLRARTLISEFSRSRDAGVYLRMGNTSAEVYRAANQPVPSADYLSKAEVNAAATFATTLRRLDQWEFELLCRHGYEVADATLASRQSSRFTPKTRPKSLI
ncbi:MAG: patatin-like phospholipase family protein [Gammaproteobacteria bacterium]|nr:patatin-like phospholipase family protein [Gammaproteobacteria bacterium]